MTEESTSDLDRATGSVPFDEPKFSVNDVALPFFIQHLSDTRSYHHHKENMAHASLLVQAGLAGFIVVTENWPPIWMKVAFSLENYITIFIVLIFWGTIHSIITWQLRLRSLAAIEYAAVLQLLYGWSTSPPTREDLELLPDRVKLTAPIWRRAWGTLWPSAKGHLFGTWQPHDLPRCLAGQRRTRERIGISTNDKIIAIGSIFIGFIMLCRSLTAFCL